MANIKVSKAKSLKGEIEVPGDKSISHRAIIIGALAKGRTYVKKLLNAEDILSTIECMRSLGVKIENNDTEIIINGKDNLSQPEKILDVGNSGTSIRLLLGVLAAQNFNSIISGDSSIQRRPMGRVMIPLTMMGAKFKIKGRDINIDELLNSSDVFYPPIESIGGNLKGIKYVMPVASAQVKSAVLLGGLKAKGKTMVVEPGFSRDHTEKMLEYFGAKISINANEISLEGANQLYGKEIIVPGDISSAAFFIAAASLIKGSELVIKNVGLNPRRTGIIDIMKKMGADIVVRNKTIINKEDRGDLFVKYSKLNGISIGGKIIPKLIDEIPIIALLGAAAKGIMVISDAKELRIKESDRLKVISTELSKFGVGIEEKEDGLIIHGGKKLSSAKVNSFKDHRMAMTFIIAGLLADGETEIENIECINTSFPGFLDILNGVLIA